MPLNKFISGLLAALLLISNSGFALNVHFCEGKIASVSTTFSSIDACEMMVDDEKKCCSSTSEIEPCCQDKTLDLNKSTEVVVKMLSVDHFSPLGNVNWLIEDASPQVETTSEKILNNHVNEQSKSLFKLYHQFIFYA